MNIRAIPGAYLFRLYVFRLTNVIPEQIIFVSQGITVKGNFEEGASPLQYYSKLK